MNKKKKNIILEVLIGYKLNINLLIIEFIDQYNWVENYEIVWKVFVI